MSPDKPVESESASRNILTQPIVLPRVPWARIWQQRETIAAWVIGYLVFCHFWMVIGAVWGVAPVSLPDSPVFRIMARFDPHAIISGPLQAGPIWAGIRPPLVPIIYALCGHSDRIFVFAQALGSALAWSLLALAVAANLRHWAARVAGVYVVLQFASTNAVIYWNRVVMSEGWFFSLAALHLAAWLFLIRVQNKWTLGGVALTAVLWVGSRDTAAYCLLPAIAACLVAAFWQGRRFAALAGVLLLIASASNYSASAARRWEFPLVNSIFYRVLPDPKVKTYFVERGMPDTSAVRGMERNWASGQNWAYYRSPELADFRQWVRSEGKRVYASYLLSRPLETIREIQTDKEGVITPFFVSPQQYFPGTKDTAQWLVYAAACVIILGWQRKALAGVALALAVSAALSAVVTFHGDWMEQGRHSLFTAVGLRLAPLLVATLAVDVALQYTIFARKILFERLTFSRAQYPTENTQLRNIAVQEANES